MRNILTKFEFHYSFLIMALGLIITGHFSNLIVFTSLILIHESGHLIFATLFKYDIDKVIIYPYGGLCKFKMRINTNIEKDLLISISGVLMQSLFFGIIFLLYTEGIVREYIFNLFSLYHKSMLIFNLLPIVPLDGSKILNLFLSKFLSFNFVNKLTVFVSLITIIFLLLSNIYERNYSFVFVIGILIYNIYKFYRDIAYIYSHFLLERYLYNIKYRKHKVIRDSNKMHKNKTHYFIKGNNIIPEKAFLDDFFHKRL